jgi:large subunit ribosomal protein L15
MNIGLHNLRPAAGSNKKKKRLGRGAGSGHGKTSGRGTKGQRARSGRDFYRGFEGGQMPLIRKIPKRGFSNAAFKKRYQIVKLDRLSQLKESVITPAVLEEKGAIRDKDRPVKILAGGSLSQALAVKADAFSAKAKEKIEGAGGKAQVIKDR